MDTEIWKDIQGYEGLYQVSNKGKVNSSRYGRNIILSPGICSKQGHSIIYLKNKGKGERGSLHRLVAQYFIPNPFNLPLVCHKDETLDENGMLYNGVDNLFWGTHKDNSQDMSRKGRSGMQGICGEKNRFAKKINQYTLESIFIKEWGSIIDAEIKLGIHYQNISRCCKGTTKTAGGFIWKYK